MYKIVIVEDEKSVADGLKEMLQTYAAERELDLRIEEFESGDSFLQSGCSDYDIVLLDINMPGNNGIQVAKEIRMGGVVIRTRSSSSAPTIRSMPSAGTRSARSGT